MDVHTGMNIAALAHRTGVAADTLRKWEQRYRILRPARTAGGQRRYSERDVARVEWLRDRLADGYRIGEAAALLGESEEHEPLTATELQDALYFAAVRGTAGEVGRLLDHAFALHTVEQACAEVVAPLLHRIGDGWAAGKLPVAHEHLVSEAVRARLQAWTSYTRGGTRGCAVLACAPGERHDLGLLLVAALMGADGWGVTYLGADTPVGDALALAERLDADVLAFSVTMTEHIEALRAAGKPAKGARAGRVLGGRAATAGLARAIGAQTLGDDLGAAVAELRSTAAAA